MKRATFVVTYGDELAHPMHRRITAGHEVSRMELLQWAPTDSVSTLSWYDGDPDAVADLLGAVDSAETTDLVAGDDGTYAFVHQSAYELGAPVLDLVDRSPVVFRPPVTFLASGEARFEAVGQAEHLGAFYDALRDAVTTRIERVEPFRRWPGSEALTERQRTALEAAVDVGYYAIPRTGDLENVAAELDCARSTAGELVRKAESAVLTEFVRSE